MTGIWSQERKVLEGVVWCPVGLRRLLSQPWASLAREECSPGTRCPRCWLLLILMTSEFIQGRSALCWVFDLLLSDCYLCKGQRAT